MYEYNAQVLRVVDGDTFNNMLVAEGHAAKYTGGKK